MDDDATDTGAFGEFGVPACVIPKNRREEVRIGLNEYKGVEYIDIRSFFLAPDGFRPSRRGITLPTRLYRDLLLGIVELGALLGEVDQQALAELDRDA